MDQPTKPEDGPANDPVKQKIMSLVAPLPVRVVYDVLRQLCELSFTGPAERLEQVKHTFVEYLNTRRPQRARRLFTDLFEPILISDGVLLRARRMVPGAVQRVDAAGLWAALNRTAFAEVATRVQHRLDEMAAATLLEDVFQDPEAVTLRRQLRDEAILVLERVLDDARTLPGFLETLNRRRMAEARRQALYLGGLAPAEAHFVRFIVDYLATADAVVAILQQHLPGTDAGGDRSAPGAVPDPDAEAGRLAEALSQAVVALRALVPSGGVSELAQLAPLSALNAGRHYGAVARYIRDNGLTGDGDDAYIIEGLIAHFAACCATLVEVFGNALKLGERLPGALIKFTAREIADLDGVLRRLGLVLPALIAAGLLDHRVTAPLFQQIWENLARFFAEQLAVVATQRVTATVSARGYPTLDHQDVVWLVRMIWAWHLLSRVHGQGFAVFDQWRDQIMDEVALAVKAAVRLDGGETIADRFDHILRLNEIAAVFGRSVGQLLPLSSQNVAAMMAYSLEEHRDMPAGERALVVEFLGLVRAEMVRSRNWRNADLAALVRLAETLGL